MMTKYDSKTIIDLMMVSSVIVIQQMPLKLCLTITIDII